jgi:hypothetical protein
MVPQHGPFSLHFTLCLRARDYIKRLSQHPWYGLWMRVKGPHHYKVTALGSVALRYPHSFAQFLQLCDSVRVSEMDMEFTCIPTYMWIRRSPPRVRAYGMNESATTGVKVELWDWQPPAGSVGRAKTTVVGSCWPDLT